MTDVNTRSILRKVFTNALEASFPRLTLDRLQKKGEHAYKVSDYSTAVQKWPAGLDQGSVLGQYQQALEYYKQVLTIKREFGDRRGEVINLGNIGYKAAIT